MGQTSSGTIDRSTFWAEFPIPEDAEVLPVVEGIDLAFATDMDRDELFEAYAEYLHEEGWQAVWKKAGAELRMEFRGRDDQGRAVVWLQLSS